MTDSRRWGGSSELMRRPSVLAVAAKLKRRLNTSMARLMRFTNLAAASSLSR